MLSTNSCTIVLSHHFTRALLCVVCQQYLKGCVMCKQYLEVQDARERPQVPAWLVLILGAGGGEGAGGALGGQGLLPSWGGGRVWGSPRGGGPGRGASRPETAAQKSPGGRRGWEEDILCKSPASYQFSPPSILTGLNMLLIILFFCAVLEVSNQASSSFLANKLTQNLKNVLL